MKNQSLVSSINWPNVVTVSRVILAFVVFALLLSGGAFIDLCFVLTLLVIAGDYLDGQLARRLKQASVFGAWLDIASDRLVEICFWIVFASLHWVSPWIAIIFVTRGVLVDGVRSFAQGAGFTAFGDKTMMNSALGKFIVASPFSRVSYAVSKAAAFGLVILAQKYTALNLTANILVYSATFFCIIRGVPVLLEGARFLNTAPENGDNQSG
jgi:phosphatidylglycerophosphate synthase